MADKGKDKSDAKSGNGSDTGQQQASFPLFYTDPQPLDAEKHKEYGLIENFGLGFTSGVNAVPINLVEMPQICHHYPIAFSPDESSTPVAIMGLRDTENLFLTSDGGWKTSGYIPAYIRRYPFIFSEMPGSDQLSLCVDMDAKVVAKDGGQPFFDKDGNPTDLSKNALEFCKSYHAAAQQTIELSKALNENGLLIERQAEINLYDNRRINFSGFRIVDEEKLGNLDDKVFLEFRKKGWLPYIYAHLFSGAQWQNLTRLLNEILQSEAA